MSRVDISPFLESTKPLLEKGCWDPEQEQKSLSILFNAIVDLAHNTVKYYRRKRFWKAVLSGVLRISGYTLGVVGVLCPLLASAKGVPFLENVTSDAMRSYGYILLALAAGLIGADTIFGATTGRMRYVASQLQVEVLLEKLTLDWQKIWPPSPGTDSKKSRAPFMEVLSEFASSFSETVLEEEKTWQTDLKQRIEQLQKQMAASRDGSSPSATRA